MADYKRSIRSYLDQIKDDKIKDRIIIMYKELSGIPTQPDSQPMDYYRHLGMQTVRLDLVTELNKFIMEHACNYSFHLPWCKELWEMRCNTIEIISSVNAIIRALIYQGIPSGLYSESDTKKEEKDVTGIFQNGCTA
jgi:hypothetical protein